MVKNYPTWNVYNVSKKLKKPPAHHQLIHHWINYTSTTKLGFLCSCFFVFAHTYSPVKLRQFLFNSLTYQAVHKPKFALVQDEGLYCQKSQCSGKVFLVLLHWVSCDLWPKTSLCRSHQYQQQSSGPMEWFWLCYWFRKVIAAVSGTPQGIQHLLTRIFCQFKFFSIIYSSSLTWLATLTRRGRQSIYKN